MSHPGGGWARLLARAAVCLGLAYTLLAGLGIYTKVTAEGAVRFCDFAPMYAASTFVAEGDPTGAYQPPRLLERQRQRIVDPLPKDLPFSYPPYWAMVLRPLASLDFHPALALWVGLQMAAFAAAVAWTLGSPEGALVALALPLTTVNMGYGQGGLVAATLLLVALGLLDRRPAASGAAFAFLAFKPHLAALAPVALVAGRHWRALGACAATWVAWVLASVLVLGAETWGAFFTRLTSQGQTLRQGDLPFADMTSAWVGARTLGAPGWLAGAIQLGCSALALVLVVRAFRGPAAPARRAATLSLATLVFSPQGVAYDLAWTAPALLALGQDLSRRGGRGRDWGVFVAGVMLPLLGPALTRRVPLPVVPLVLVVLLLHVQARWPDPEVTP